LEHSSGVPVFLHHLRHKIARFSHVLLHLACDVGVGAEHEAYVEMAEYTVVHRKQFIFDYSEAVLACSMRSGRLFVFPAHTGHPHFFLPVLE